jgi:predicted small integral membrane protein
MTRILAGLGSLRMALTLFTAITAVYFAVVALNNITDFGTNQQFVHHVLAMDTTFVDDDVMWRAITNPTLANIAYITIITWETLTALVQITALIGWIRALAGQGDAELPRRLSILGWLMVIALFGLGFIAIGGEWFVMWESKTWNGLQAALQNVLIASVGVILAHLPERVAE